MATSAMNGRPPLTEAQYQEQFPALSRDTYDQKFPTLSRDSQNRRTSLSANAGLNLQEHTQWTQHVQRDPSPIEQPKSRDTYAFVSARSGRELKRVEKREQKTKEREQEQSDRKWHKTIDPNSTTKKSEKVYRHTSKAHRYKGMSHRTLR